MIKSPNDFKSQNEINDVIASHDDFKSQTSIDKFENNNDIPEPEDFIAEEIIAERKQSEVNQISEDPDLLSPKSSGKHVTLNPVAEQVFVQTDSDCSDSVSFSHKNPPTQYRNFEINQRHQNDPDV